MKVRKGKNGTLEKVPMSDTNLLLLITIVVFFAMYLAVSPENDAHHD